MQLVANSHLDASGGTDSFSTPFEKKWRGPPAHSAARLMWNAGLGKPWYSTHPGELRATQPILLTLESAFIFLVEGMKLEMLDVSWKTKQELES